MNIQAKKAAETLEKWFDLAIKECEYKTIKE